MTAAPLRKSDRSFQLIGLTGGIASGKSAASRIFQEFGVPVLDADVIARELSAPGGAAHAPILKRFGTAERAELREKVFADPAARKDLERILHPLIVAESLKRASALVAGRAGNPAVLYEAALLVETGRHRDLDGLIVVDSPLPARFARLMARDRISEDMAQSMIAAQSPDEERRRAATYLLKNDGDEAHLRAAVVEAIRALNLVPQA